MLKKQNLEVNDKTLDIILTNTIDLEPVMKYNYEMRKDIGKGLGSTWRPVASIPQALLERDIDGIAFLNAIPGTPEERMALKRFFGKYPEYKTCEGSI